MRYIIFGLFVAGLSAFQVGCSKSESESTPAPEVVASAPTAVEAVAAVASQVVETQVAEAGCATCIYGMEGVQGCQLAVKVAEKAYLVSGAEIDAHAAGLCSGAKQAEIAGKIEGGIFIASRLELKP